jgi:tetratricopeptide (TPR) repeat protein
VPLEPPDEQHWQAAAGYVELGMFLEADTELDKIDPFNRAAPEVLAIRLAIYQGLKKWELMQEVAKRLVEFEPENSRWAVLLAYATRRAISVKAAKEVLLKAEPKFPKEPVFKYNLACYECQLGNLESAKNYLTQTFELDASWRLAALTDKDLEALWGNIVEQPTRNGR